MADSWIKMRKKLLTDPRVWAMSRNLEISVHAVIGALFHMWCIADEHGGYLYGFDAYTLDDMLRTQGFTKALPECWLQVQEHGVLLPEYDEHNGSTGKRRALEAKRMANRRKEYASNANNKRTKTVPREDKIREDTTTTLSDKSDDDREPSKAEVRFGRFWSFYPRKIGKGKAWAVFKRLSAEDQDEAIEQAEAYAQAFEMAPDARRQFFKHPQTWLNGRCWEDDHAEWQLLIEGK